MSPFTTTRNAEPEKGDWPEDEAPVDKEAEEKPEDVSHFVLAHISLSYGLSFRIPAVLVPRRRHRGTTCSDWDVA